MRAGAGDAAVEPGNRIEDKWKPGDPLVPHASPASQLGVADSRPDDDLRSLHADSVAPLPSVTPTNAMAFEMCRYRSINVRRYDGRVTLEHAPLDVIPGEESEFERAFDEAKAIIEASPGFRSLRLARCVERPNRYLLLVEWETLQDHTVGFRGSAAYEQWRRLLHHFYEPFPVVEHYEDFLAIR